MGIIKKEKVMANSKFKIGQAVSFPSTGLVGDRARKGGIITAIEKMYELIRKNKLKLYGLFFDISSGDLSMYNEASNKFDLLS